MKDRYKLDLFHLEREIAPPFLKVQEIVAEVNSVDALYISTLAMDFPNGTSTNYRNELESKWIELLPTLQKVKFLNVRHRINQDFFEAICAMKNLKSLLLGPSIVEDISSIAKLKNLESITLESFARLEDISPLLTLRKLRLLDISNSFNVSNYDLIGEMTWLIGLKINGNASAPKNLRLKSIKHFDRLHNLRHLDLSFSSVVDNSYSTLLSLKFLERFDSSVRIPQIIRNKIKQEHKNLKAGFFVDWNYDRNEFYADKQW